MSNFRELQEKLQKIEESYYSDLDLSIQELRRANPKMSAVNLVRLARAELGDEAANYLSDQLETEGDVSDYFAGSRRQKGFPHPIQDEVVQEGPLDNDHRSQEKNQNWQDVLRAKLASAETKDYPWSRKNREAADPVDDGFDDWLEKWPGERIEEDEPGTFNDDGSYNTSDDEAVEFDDYDPDTDMFDESWPQEETHAEMVEYWKGSLSRSIISKGVFTQMYDAAGSIEELTAAIADKAESIADRYHGGGEGIGSSDQNYFIDSIANQLGIEDVFGWDKPREVEEGAFTNWNNKRKSKKHGTQAVDAWNKASEYDWADKNRDEHEAEFLRQMKLKRKHSNPSKGLEEAKGNVVKVPHNFLGNYGDTGDATSKDVDDFIRELGIDDQVSHDVVDPETGELLFQTGQTKRELKKSQYVKLNHADFTRGATLSPTMHSGFDTDNFEGKQEAAYELLDELRNSDFYNVVWREVGGVDMDTGDEDAMQDYDTEYEVPVAIKRKDGKKLDDDDHDNMREIVKAVKNGSTMGNTGIHYAGVTNKGTTARFVPTFF